jgi:hypothetical protein
MFELEGDWRRDGYVVARQVFAPERVAQLKVIAERCLVQYCHRGPEQEDGLVRTPEETVDQRTMRQLHHPGYYAPGERDELATLLESVADPRILALVESIFGMPPLFRCTSLFFNPLGASTDGACPDRYGLEPFRRRLFYIKCILEISYGEPLTKYTELSGV